MYVIAGTVPRTDIPIGRYCLSIYLHPELPDIVKASGLTQEDIDHKIEQQGREWLKAYRFNTENLPFARSAIRLTWGEWGIEHLTVPGNACGLDIDSSFGGPWLGGKALTPHNLDTADQQALLILVFTEFMYDVALFASDKHEYFQKRSV